MKNSPYFRCLTLPQYFILMHINDTYGTGAFALELLGRYTIRATNEQGEAFLFEWDIHTKQISKQKEACA